MTVAGCRVDLSKLGKKGQTALKHATDNKKDSTAKILRDAGVQMERSSSLDGNGHSAGLGSGLFAHLRGALNPHAIR